MTTLSQGEPALSKMIADGEVEPAGFNDAHHLPEARWLRSNGVMIPSTGSVTARRWNIWNMAPPDRKGCKARGGKGVRPWAQGRRGKGGKGRKKEGCRSMQVIQEINSVLATNLILIVQYCRASTKKEPKR
jgi:hypothetical protein